MKLSAGSAPSRGNSKCKVQRPFPLRDFLTTSVRCAGVSDYFPPSLCSNCKVFALAAPSAPSMTGMLEEQQGIGVAGVE